jgi:septum formation protein
MLILASKSQTRITLLENAGYQFDAKPTRIDERKVEEKATRDGADQAQMTARLAEAKAHDVSKSYPQALIVGADQTLAFQSEYLHKSADFDALRDQLDRLRGQTHTLCSAVCLVKNGKTLWQHQSIAEMKMREFSEQLRDEIIKLEGEALLKSVGGYRLEGPSIRLFEDIKGDYFTILGLPLLPLTAALEHYLDK